MITPRDERLLPVGVSGGATPGWQSPSVLSSRANKKDPSARVKRPYGERHLTLGHFKKTLWVKWNLALQIWTVKRPLFKEDIVFESWDDVDNSQGWVPERDGYPSQRETPHSPAAGPLPSQSGTPSYIETSIYHPDGHHQPPEGSAGRKLKVVLRRAAVMWYN